MKLTLDSSICRKYKLSVDEALMVLIFSRVTKFRNLKLALIRKELITQNEEGAFIITSQGKTTINSILKESTEDFDQEKLMNLANQLIEVYPPGKVPGTSYHYRSNPRDVAEKLKKFYIKYGEYSDEQIVDATRRFVEENKHDPYFPTLRYFIWKKKGEEEISQLSSYLENTTNEDMEKDDEDWTRRLI